jgi:outer membrane protein TolC
MRHPGWRVGGILEMPLDNGEARARRQAQALRVQAAGMQLKSESVTLGNEWATRRSQWVAVLDERQQLQRELAGREILLQAERESYEFGRIRLRSLIEAQDRLTDSRLRLLEAGVRLDLAVLALQAVAGDLLVRFNVRVEP